jgi:pyruvate kinase
MSGSTVQRISRERPPCRIICLTPLQRTASKLALSWGVEPVVMKDPVNFDDMLGSVQNLAVNQLGLKKGDTIMISAGIPFGHPGTTNTLKIATID